jgi:hypothetical protein
MEEEISCLFGGEISLSLRNELGYCEITLLFLFGLTICAKQSKYNCNESNLKVFSSIKDSCATPGEMRMMVN